MANTAPVERFVIAGGSGFVGISAATYLAEAGTSVVILSRRPPAESGPWRHVAWDGRSTGPWIRELDGAAGLINLAGRSVDCIKTPAHQDEILRSRVESTRVLGQAMRRVENRPPVWIQMSTAHIYGDPPEAVCDESSPFGYGLAPFVGQAWEEEFNAGVLPSQRGVVLRTSFVLGRRRRGGQPGALDRLAWLARIGLGGRIGTGTQGLSWIHEADLNRLIQRALNDPSMTGPYIASAPMPVSQREFMRELRRAVGMPIGLPTSEWMVRFGARFVLQTDPELALCGRYVVPRRLLNEGFEFRFAKLSEALEDLLRQRSAVGRTSGPSA